MATIDAAVLRLLIGRLLMGAYGVDEKTWLRCGERWCYSCLQLLRDDIFIVYGIIFSQHVKGFARP